MPGLVRARRIRRNNVTRDTHTHADPYTYNTHTHAHTHTYQLCILLLELVTCLCCHYCAVAIQSVYGEALQALADSEAWKETVDKELRLVSSVKMCVLSPGTLCSQFKHMHNCPPCMVGPGSDLNHHWQSFINWVPNIQSKHPTSIHRQSIIIKLRWTKPVWARINSGYVGSISRKKRNLSIPLPQTRMTSSPGRCSFWLQHSLATHKIDQ